MHLYYVNKFDTASLNILGITVWNKYVEIYMHTQK